MAFKRMILKGCIGFGSSGGPTFRTSIVATEGGIESRNEIWQYQRSQYELAYAPDVGISFEELYKFFKVARGSLHSFLINDPLDNYAAPGEGLFITSYGSPTAHQMIKRITVDGYTVDMLVTKPKQGAITVTGGGTVNYDTGTVSGSPTAWYGHYYKHVRFDTDSIQPVIQNKRRDGSLIVGWETIPLIEVRGDNENS